MRKMELALFVFLVTLFLLGLGICDVAMNTSLWCIERERAALLSFKATLSYPVSNNKTVLPSWNSSNRDCCSWEGVTCHKITGHVITLNLTKGNKPYEDTLVANTIDSSLLGLKHLTYLDLSCISFNFNQFPAYLGSLKQLQYLNLSGTSFYGVVPQSLGNLSSLHTLDLSTSGYYGLRADDLMWASRLSSLEHLDISGVNLQNATHVFEVLYTLPSLVFLSLSSNGLNYTHLPNSCINSTLPANLQHLDLSLNYFHGEIPCFLPNMTSLTFLDLTRNMFNLSAGTRLLGMKNLTYLSLAYNWFDEKVDWISEFLGDKNHLKSLDLSSTSFYGDVSRVFKNLSSHNLELESLSLKDNHLFGELPQELGELQHLIYLDLSQNLLNGPIPISLGKLPALTFLDISSNNLSGQLPSSLGNLTSLSMLSLSRNRLSGEIPISLGELSNLVSIDISFNSFHTTLSEAHFAKLSELVKLDLSFNKMIRFGVGYDWVPPFQLTYLMMRSTKMVGQFPKWLQTQKALLQLDMSNCSITGTLPSSLHSMGSLIELYLSHNNISGFSSSNMTYLDLSDNIITHLPTNIGHMIPSVSWLNLARNLINSSIPDSLCQMKDLAVLDLSKNHFSGNLPNCWPYLQNLRVASFSSNELTGIIPRSIGGARFLLRLHLDENRLTGQLPSTLKNCKNLEMLDVGGNNLSGKIPQWIGRDGPQYLQFLLLRNNDFSGTIPRELCRLSYLQVMDLANNNLTGNIPRCFANFSGMMHVMNTYQHHTRDGVYDSFNQVLKGVDLEYRNYWNVFNLDLSSNHLVGRIPTELTALVGLVGLNLSHNLLGGQIPANIGDLESLESLDLSSNNLVGEIPQSLSNLSFLSHLNLSDNDLYGPIPAGRQLQTFTDPSIYDGNPLLCGAPLQRKCDGAGIAPDVQSHEEEGDEDRADKIWFYGIIIAGFAMGFWAVIGVMVVKTKWRQAYSEYIEVLIAKMLGY